MIAKPDYAVFAQGHNITPLMAGRLVSIETNDDYLYASDSFSIIVENGDGKLKIPRRGAILEIQMGYAGNLRSIGKYIVDAVTALTPPDQIEISGNAAPFMDTSQYKALQSRRSRSFDSMTLGALATQIAGEHGLTPEVSDEVNAIVLPHTDQTNESDINFLRRLSDIRGVMIKPTFDRLVAVTKASVSTTHGHALPTVTVLRSQITNSRVEMLRRVRFNSVTAYWYDVKTAQLGAVIWGDGDMVLTLDQTFPDQASAQTAAVAKLAAVNRRGVTFEITMPGRTDIIPEQPALFPDLIQEFAKEVWRITNVRHRLTRTDGFATTISGELLLVPPPVDDSEATP